jgi:DNA-directed RNA polymerase specialized sigma24 family protein
VNAAKDLPEATSAAPAPHRLTRDIIDLFCRNRRYNRPRKALVEPVETPAPAQRVERAEPVYNLPAAWDGLPEDHRALLAALGTLDAEDRVILVLKDVEGRSYAGAGEILELGESSMRSRVSSARERLHAAVRKLAEQKKP